MNSVVLLLCCLMNLPVQNGKDIVLLIMFWRTVFLNDLQSLWHQSTGNLFSCFVTGIIDSVIADIGILQGGYIPEIDSCCQVGK